MPVASGNMVIFDANKKCLFLAGSICRPATLLRDIVALLKWNVGFRLKFRFLGSQKVETHWDIAFLIVSACISLEYLFL